MDKKEVKNKIELGDIFFSKKVRTSAEGNFLETEFTKSQLIGMAIGQVPDGTRNPTDNEVLSLIAGAGFISFTHIANCLGNEAMEKMREYVKERFKDKETQDGSNDNDKEVEAQPGHDISETVSGPKS